MWSTRWRAGVHAKLLQEQGYQVDLLDPLEHHVNQARAAGTTAVDGDARRRPWENGQAEALQVSKARPRNWPSALRGGDAAPIRGVEGDERAATWCDPQCVNTGWTRLTRKRESARWTRRPQSELAPKVAPVESQSALGDLQRHDPVVALLRRSRRTG
jgi:hypothetical protein